MGPPQTVAFVWKNSTIIGRRQACGVHRRSMNAIAMRSGSLRPRNAQNFEFQIAFFVVCDWFFCVLFLHGLDRSPASARFLFISIYSGNLVCFAMFLILFSFFFFGFFISPFLIPELKLFDIAVSRLVIEFESNQFRWSLSFPSWRVNPSFWPF